MIIFVWKFWKIFIWLLDVYSRWNPRIFSISIKTLVFVTNYEFEFNISFNKIF